MRMTPSWQLCHVSSCNADVTADKIACHKLAFRTHLFDGKAMGTNRCCSTPSSCRQFLEPLAYARYHLADHELWNTRVNISIFCKTGSTVNFLHEAIQADAVELLFVITTIRQMGVLAHLGLLCICCTQQSCIYQLHLQVLDVHNV